MWKDKLRREKGRGWQNKEDKRKISGEIKSGEEKKIGKKRDKRWKLDKRKSEK